MPRRALRSYPTKYATDLTDAHWAAIAQNQAKPSFISVLSQCS